MKIKGFTLIELLAVIVILAIIALIATPIILGIINNVREESNKRSIELYANAVRNAIASYQLINLDTPKIFSDLNVEYRGDIDCRVKELYEDGSFYLEGCKVNKSENEYSYGTKKEINKACALQDLDQDGKASLSDVVTCGSESFYVMTNENNEITMLSMYNLNVGNNIYLSGEIGIQNENVFGEKKGYTTYGVVPFSSSKYWHDGTNYIVDVDYVNEGRSRPYVYGDYKDLSGNQRNNIYIYISEYKEYLEENGVNIIEIRLIKYEELNELGCSGSRCTDSLSWLYLTQYWTGSAYNSRQIMGIDSGNFVVYSEFSNLKFGVRPVVTISTSEI